MQIIDSSELGLRSARLLFRSSTSSVTVTLFPMIHLGEAAFYEAVYRDAFAHDAVLVEGVRSRALRRMTRVYRWIADDKRIGLVVQPRYPRQADSRAEIIHADLSTDEFERHWRKVPLHIRWLGYVAAPVYGLYQRWFGSRASLAHGHALDDLPSRSETLSWTPEFASYDAAMVDKRDARLIELMGAYIESEPTASRRLAVVYGAGHMRAVIRELSRRGFHCVDSEWMLIFPLQLHRGSNPESA
jgi:hypothetical protein